MNRNIITSRILLQLRRRPEHWTVVCERRKQTQRRVFEDRRPQNVVIELQTMFVATNNG